MRSPTFLNSVVVRRGTVTTVIMANMLQAEVIYVILGMKHLGAGMQSSFPCFNNQMVDMCSRWPSIKQATSLGKELPGVLEHPLVECA